MKKCIYCLSTKNDEEFSLEHIIPQFLGGAYAPDYFKTNNVCKICNNNLGLFVDASFEKNFLVHNHLRMSANSLFDPANPTSLPLQCMGILQMKPPHMNDNEVCEFWIGPLGESIYWIRLADENMYWYSGGNPRTIKSQNTTAYFFFSERSKKNVLLSWLTFKDAFEGKKVKKIMCSEVEGEDPKSIGFSEHSEIDKARIDFFKSLPNEEYKKCQVSFNKDFDLRFLSKIALGISYSFFGEKILNNGYSKELYKGIWYRETEVAPEILTTQLFTTTEQDENFKNFTGVKNTVTLLIFPINLGLGFNLNINRELNWSTICTDKSALLEPEIKQIGDGLALILIKSLKQSIILTMPQLICHHLKYSINTELKEIESKTENATSYFKQL